MYFWIVFFTALFGVPPKKAVRCTKGKSKPLAILAPFLIDALALIA